MAEKNIQIISRKDIPKHLKTRIRALRASRLARSCDWEMARKAEPISATLAGTENAFELFAVVHKESYFILNMRVCTFGEQDAGSAVFLEAVEQHRMLPDRLLVREDALRAELIPFASLLDIPIERVRVLATIPSIFRSLTQMLNVHN